MPASCSSQLPLKLCSTTHGSRIWGESLAHSFGPFRRERERETRPDNFKTELKMWALILSYLYCIVCIPVKVYTVKHKHLIVNCPVGSEMEGRMDGWLPASPTNTHSAHIPVLVEEEAVAAPCSSKSCIPPSSSLFLGGVGEEEEEGASLLAAATSTLCTILRHSFAGVVVYWTNSTTVVWRELGGRVNAQHHYLV